MGTHHGTGVLAQRGRKIVVADASLLVCGQDGQFQSLILQQEEGTEHRIVLQRGRDDMVTRCKQAKDGRTQRIGRVIGKAYPGRVIQTEQLGQLGAAVEYRPSSRKRQRMTAASG